MSEQNKEQTKVVTVGEMEPEAFFHLLGSVIEQILAHQRQSGDKKLLDMSVEEFSVSMIEVFKRRAFQTAAAETSIAEQVITDWKGLEDVSAIAHPFRVKSAEDALRLYITMSDSFKKGMQGEYVVALAVTTGRGLYGRGPIVP